jgi:hypothetical protein
MIYRVVISDEVEKYLLAGWILYGSPVATKSRVWQAVIKLTPGEVPPIYGALTTVHVNMPDPKTFQPIRHHPV